MIILVQTLGKANLVQTSGCSIASMGTCREKLGKLRQSAAELQLRFLVQIMLIPCPRSALDGCHPHLVMSCVAGADKHRSARA